MGGVQSAEYHQQSGDDASVWLGQCFDSGLWVPDSSAPLAAHLVQGLSERAVRFRVYDRIAYLFDRR